MNVLCPNCLKRVAVPDEAAGKPTPCPACGHTFTPPALTPAALDASPIPAKGPTMEPTSPPLVAPSLAGAPCCTVTLSPRWVRWVAPPALVLAFVLSFFPWVGSYPNGTAVYTQSAWKAMRGGDPAVVNTSGDDVMQKHDALVKHSRVDGLLLLYCLLLIPAALLSVGLIATGLVTFTMPDALKRVWNYRDLALAGLSVLLPILLVTPLLFGFGLENAADAAAEEKFPPLTALADGSKPKAKDLQARDAKRDVEVASFALDRTWWLRLALLAQAAALAGTGAKLWLNRRGGKPAPRAEFYG